MVNIGHASVFQIRLQRYGLRPLEVGGGGNCLFRVIAHQLYNNSNRHFEIRAAGVQYLQNNPERFIESGVLNNMSWFQYISNMSREGTWGDHIIMQAIADAFNLRINVVESSENFAEVTLVEPVNVSLYSRSVYIGHIGEMHYVSTIPITHGTTPQSHSQRTSLDSDDFPINNRKRKSIDTTQNQCILPTLSANKQTAYNSSSKTCVASFQSVSELNCAQYQRACRAKMSSPEQKAKQNAQQKVYRHKIASPEQRAKRNAQQKAYREKIASSQQRAKRNAQQKAYREKIASPEQRAKHNAQQKAYR